MNINAKRIAGYSFAGLAVVVFLFVKHLADTIWGVLRLPIPSDLPVTPADILAAVCAVLVFVILKKNERVNVFTNEVIVELSKVTWPPRKETLLSGIVVSVMVAICALILFGFDTVWGTLINMLYK